MEAMGSHRQMAEIGASAGNTAVFRKGASQSLPLTGSFLRVRLHVGIAAILSQ